MKTEASHPGITVLRLTALANAADRMIRAIENEDDFDEDEPRRVRAATRILSDAVEVARGADRSLPAVLFESTADRSAVRLAAYYGLIT